MSDTALLDPALSRSRSAEALEAIREPACSLAIWERDPIAGAEALIPGTQQDLRFTAKLAELPARLTQELDGAGYPAIPARAALEADIAELARRFAPLIEADAVEVRLERVTTNSCRKFHADYVSARLITSYVGTGTQWLEQGDADRVAAGQEPEQIHTMGAGDVGVFKGKLATDAPAIHRSPAIEGTGETRLLMVLNPPMEG